MVDLMRVYNEIVPKGITQAVMASVDISNDWNVPLGRLEQVIAALQVQIPGTP
jgi:hypothetical protein